MPKYAAVIIGICSLLLPRVKAQEALRNPTDPIAAQHVRLASDWLRQHIQSGQVTWNAQTVEVALVAWQDPTLSTNHLPVAYTITDNLWAAYALQVAYPLDAKAISASLRRLDCDRNNLHEVVWQPIADIHHRFVSDDVVHGRSIGQMLINGQPRVDIRKFETRRDDQFTSGHPVNFVEHAVYQSLFEFRNGNKSTACERIRRIFAASPDQDQLIKWDSQRQLLIDQPLQAEYSQLCSGARECCKQITFKNALLAYAICILELETELHEQRSALLTSVRRAQHPDGGAAHYSEHCPKRDAVRAPGATGEATAMLILAECITQH